MSLDLNNLKEQVQSIFQTANTTTASRDLSNGLATRVQRILKVNPARIPVQASWYPFVTCYIESKNLEEAGIAITQATSKRKAIINLKVIGAIWNSSSNDGEVDPADEDCEDLMENIEEILRANPTLSGVSLWSFPTDVTYHNVALEEETHIRAGILNLKTTIYY